MKDPEGLMCLLSLRAALPSKWTLQRQGGKSHNGPQNSIDPKNREFRLG